MLAWWLVAPHALERLADWKLLPKGYVLCFQYHVHGANNCIYLWTEAADISTDLQVLAPTNALLENLMVWESAKAGGCNVMEGDLVVVGDISLLT